MKRKGRIILVTMLAVFFLASTVHAGGWWDRGWCNLLSKISKFDKKISSLKYQTDNNTNRIVRLEKKVKKRPKKRLSKWERKKRRERREARREARMDALTQAVINAIKEDEALMAELKGEQGPEGPAGPDRARLCGGCNMSYEQNRFAGFDFNYAFLNNAQFIGTNLTEADFTDADCVSTWFVASTVAGAKFNNTDLSDAILAADFTDVDLTLARSLEGAQWSGYAWIPDNGLVKTMAGGSFEYVVATCPDGTKAQPLPGGFEPVCAGEQLKPKPAP